MYAKSNIGWHYVSSHNSEMED